MFRPGKIIDELRGMVKNIKEEYAPGRGTMTDHIDILSKGLVIIRFIDWSIGIAFYIIVKRYFFVTYELLEIIPVPFPVGRPIMRKIFYDNGFSRLVKFFPEHLRVNGIKGGNRF